MRITTELDYFAVKEIAKLTARLYKLRRTESNDHNSLAWECLCDAWAFYNDMPRKRFDEMVTMTEALTLLRETEPQINYVDYQAREKEQEKEDETNCKENANGESPADLATTVGAVC